MVKKIISGGQVGADQAALDVAIKLDIPHGGWIQKGRKTQSGNLPDKYQLKEMSTASYKERIEQNVIDADGTLIISHGKPTGGSDYSRKMALKHKRQFLHVDLVQMNTLKAAKLINSWIALRHIKILHVTGSRASEDSNIYKATMDVLESAYYLNQVETKTQAFDTARQALTTDNFAEPKVHPKTVDEAVDHLISVMPLKDRTIMANLTQDELEPLNLSLGLYIRKHLIQKDAYGELLESCRDVFGNDHLGENRAAFVIIEELWQKLQKTHKLRIVK
jgi:hypothetical protein